MVENAYIFMFLGSDQSRFHHFLHKANWWSDSRRGGGAVVYNVFSPGSSDVSSKVLG